MMVSWHQKGGRRVPGRSAICLLLILGLAGCAIDRREQVEQDQVQPPATVLAAEVAPITTSPPSTPQVAVPSSVAVTSTPTATKSPTATMLSSTATATATGAPTATADPWSAYAPYTIEGLRNRSYGEGQIEIVRVMEQTPSFTRYLIAYRSDGLRITGMMNRPKGNGPFPVVILNHGYYPLDVYQTGNGSKLAADYLAARGYLALASDFRSHAGSGKAPNLFRAGHVIDTLNLIALAQKLPEAQPGKVGMWGHSNGGAITAKAITVSDQIAAALIYAPASSNIVEDYQFRVERARSRGQEIDKVEWPVAPAQAPDLYERLSPLPYLRYVGAPVQIHWGTADETVPRKWPEDLRAGLEAAGKDVTMYVYDGQPHSFKGAGNELYLRRMVELFDRYLRMGG